MSNAVPHRGFEDDDNDSNQCRNTATPGLHACVEDAWLIQSTTNAEVPERRSYTRRFVRPQSTTYLRTCRRTDEEGSLD